MSPTSLRRDAVPVRIVKEDVDIARSVAKRSQQQRNLSPMMNSMIGCMLHQRAQWHRTLCGRIHRVFNIASQIFVSQLAQELTHVRFDLVPGLYERFGRW